MIVYIKTCQILHKHFFTWMYTQQTPPCLLWNDVTPARGIHSMDMSKAFDTVNRTTLLEDLRQIVEPDELYLIKILLQQVKLSVKVGKTLGKEFKTNTGVPQGDCMSPILFILYLAKALGHQAHLTDHNYSLPPQLGDPIPVELHDHDYSITTEKMHEIYKSSLTIDTQYADDTSWNVISNSEHLINYQKTIIPPLLKRRNLGCNEEKTEQHIIKRGGETSWKNCKDLGSLLDTDSDIRRRKQLAITAMNNLNDVWESNRTTLNTKLKIFNLLVRPIFHHNAKLWTMTKTKDNQIDAFHRRMLRKMLNIKYPNTISNVELYSKTKEKPWHYIIAEQRLKWLGHALRLNENTPAAQAFVEAERPVKKPKGGQKTTWLKCVQNQLQKNHQLKWEDAKKLAKDRKDWRGLVAAERGLYVDLSTAKLPPTAEC